MVSSTTGANACPICGLWLMPWQEGHMCNDKELRSINQHPVDLDDVLDMLHVIDVKLDGLLSAIYQNKLPR